jgi:hypothetical protein
VEFRDKRRREKWKKTVLSNINPMWSASVIPTTWEVEVQGSLEPECETNLQNTAGPHYKK